MKRVIFKAEEADYDRWKEAAHQERVSFGEWARRLLNGALGEESIVEFARSGGADGRDLGPVASGFSRTPTQSGGAVEGNDTERKPQSGVGSERSVPPVRRRKGPVGICIHRNRTGTWCSRCNDVVR